MLGDPGGHCQFCYVNKHLLADCMDLRPNDSHTLKKSKGHQTSACDLPSVFI